MRHYLYNYQTLLTFSAPVVNHSVMLRCQPMHTDCQTILEEHVVFPPGFWTARGTDAFGNRLLFGGQRDPHGSLCYVSTGIVATEPYGVKADGRVSPIYYHPTPLTSLGGGAHTCAPKDILARAWEICREVNDRLDYVPQTTGVGTSAAEVLRLGKGVCQDYAHLMTALCRRSGIAARYVCGFVEGTGETHAWVEVYDGYRWTGFDPTHCLRIEYGYVKLAHGRDASDCAVSRGLYGGMAAQSQQVCVTLREL